MQTSKKPPASVMRQLLSASKPYTWYLITGLIAALCLSGIDALFAYLIAPIINKGFVHKDFDFIKMLPVLILVLFLCRGLFEFTSTYQMSKSTKLLLASMRKKVFDKILHLPVGYFKNQKGGAVVSLLIYNVDQLSNATTTTVLIAVREVGLMIGLIFVIFYLNWRLSLLLFIIVPPIYFLFKFSSRKIRKISRVSQTWMGNVTQITQEAIHNAEVLRLFTATDYEQQRFDNAIDEARRQDLKAVKTNSISSACTQVLFAIVLAAFLWVAMMPTMHLSAGAFAAIIGALVQLLRPIRRITTLNSSIQTGLAGAKSVFEFLNIPNEQDGGEQAITQIRGEFAFKQVGFHYENTDQLALDNISFTAKPGTITALVGYSGGGKTTLINCLPRFLLPTAGDIVLDGRHLEDYPLKPLREQMALVSQTPQLFNDSILNNITYGHASDDKCIERATAAAKAAYIWDFIESLPEGLATMIGDHGVLLSGGQKQRLAIARAIYKNAPILILDEATSALDSHSEKHIQAALDTLMEGRTTFVIAHRLSTILHADQILVLDKGKIVEQGSHQSLLEQNGLYAKLYQLQFSNPDER